MGERFVNANQSERFVETNIGRHNYDFLINAAGLDSLEIAHKMGAATELKMVPIKGRYAISKEPGDIKMLVYPVPVEGAYVLGVHSTLTPEGYVKIGPTVFPAFGKENYDMMQGVSIKSISKAISNYAHLVTSKKDRGLIWHFISNELSKSLSIQRLLNDAAKLQDMKSSEFEWYKSGIRPQLFCTEKKQLMNDFMWCKSGEHAIHLLNVVSPGWTCAMPFADYVVESLVP
jgi:L-2-hydroxyglutarate oxidase LhgO